MKKKTSPQDPALTKMKYKVHAKSPYNDGWTQEAYRREIKKIEKIERIKSIIQVTLIILVPVAIWTAIYLMSK